MNCYTAILSGKSVAELDTEIKYTLASAKINDSKLIKLVYNADEDAMPRLKGCILKVLRSVKKQGTIQFFCNDNELSASTPEAQFIMNKYSEFIEKNRVNQNTHSIYVMI